MDISDLEQRLRLVQDQDEADVVFSLGEIVADLEDSDLGLASVQPILRFLESHPTLDVGCPGPLVHHVEKFYRSGYEAELLASLQRRPTAHTVWMLNRVINGTKEPVEREKLMVALKQAGEHPEADDEVVRAVQSFLDHQG